MIFTKLGSEYVIRLEHGDDIVRTLKAFADRRRIRAGFLEGIGSLKEAKLGHYDFNGSKTYKYETFQEDLEILSMLGNISSMNRQALPHVHVTLGRRDFSVIGGHLEEGSAANMVEIVLGKLAGRLTKARDDHIGLNVLQLSHRL